MSERADAIERLILSEPAAARITPDLIGEMLQGFALPPLRGLDWLSESIRPLVFVGLLILEKRRTGVRSIPEFFLRPYLNRRPLANFPEQLSLEKYRGPLDTK